MSGVIELRKASSSLDRFNFPFEDVKLPEKKQSEAIGGVDTAENEPSKVL